MKPIKLSGKMAQPLFQDETPSPLEAMKAEKITVTLTLGEIDALHKAGMAAHEALETRVRLGLDSQDDLDDLELAMATLDEAVNG